MTKTNQSDYNIEYALKNAHTHALQKSWSFHLRGLSHTHHTLSSWLSPILELDDSVD